MKVVENKDIIVIEYFFTNQEILKALNALEDEHLKSLSFQRSKGRITVTTQELSDDTEYHVKVIREYRLPIKGFQTLLKIPEIGEVKVVQLEEDDWMVSVNFPRNEVVTSEELDGRE